VIICLVFVSTANYNNKCTKLEIVTGNLVTNRKARRYFMKNAKNIFFYWIHYPSTEPHDCWWENDIKCISRKRKNVEDAWKKEEIELGEELSKEDNRIDTFESEIVITGYKVWIIFSYDAEDPNWAKIKFLGNTQEECLKWWIENWTDYIDYEPEEDDAPEFNERWGDRMYGLLMKEMEIA
ncbi:MAG: hypothetical protein K2H53_04430, partial [Clostridia bacterium]|nr:hypothetical protein [Clostridia bacterium]